MWHDFDGLVDEVLFDLGADTDRAVTGDLEIESLGLTRAQVHLVRAHYALHQADAGRSVEANIANARSHLETAAAFQRSLEGSASRAIRAINQGNLGIAIPLVRGMYREVGGGSA